jgi:protein-S-isoprenylcysteine O-methyltransferase Ste14
VLGVAPVLALVGVRAGLGTAGDAWTTAGGWRLLGAPLALAGLALALWAVQAFARAGVAPSPVETPDRLVTDGPMQYVRNPVYLGTVGGVLGVAVLLASVVAAGYALALAVAYHLVVVRREEPALAERFGGEYDRYRRRVPRWLPAPRSPSRGADRDKS